MTPNLIEFIKVFVVVFTFSGVIISVRSYMSKLDEDNEELDDSGKILDFPHISKTMKKANLESDLIDYDGMGNQGRFPEIRK